MEERIRLLLQGPLLLLFFLMLFGLAGVALGWHCNQWLLTILGLCFLLIPPILLRSGLPLDARLGALVGTVLGAVLGGVVGALAGDAATEAVGIVGGAAAGAYCGVILAFFVMGAISSVDIGPLSISQWEVPTVVRAILVCVGMAIGAGLGVAGLREGIPRVFGVDGGGAVIGGLVGMVAGALIGVRLPHRRPRT